MTYETFEKLSTKAKELIIKETFEELKTGVRKKHSLNTIFLQGRSLSVGCRMISSSKMNIAGKQLTGKEIADAFVNAVNMNGTAYYPLTGDWTSTDVEQLVLFVKGDSSKYEPYARFKIDGVPICSSVLPIDCDNQTILDILQATNYKTLLKISNAERIYSQVSENGNNIPNRQPSSFIGVTSGIDIYECAFKGGSPNILIV